MLSEYLAGTTLKYGFLCQAHIYMVCMKFLHQTAQRLVWVAQLVRHKPEELKIRDFMLVQSRSFSLKISTTIVVDCYALSAITRFMALRKRSPFARVENVLLAITLSSWQFTDSYS